MNSRQPSRGALSRILDSVLESGRAILSGQRGSTDRPAATPEFIGKLCQQLVDHRGEASGLALAREILDAYGALSDHEGNLFFDVLHRGFLTDSSKVIEAAERYGAGPDFESLDALRRAVESPCLKLFRRLNMAPGGTSVLVAMRGKLLAELGERPQLAAIESDLRHLLIAWFNRGFLDLQRINWDSSAKVLEKIIEYEAVHEINGWDDLRNRLKEDRRLFAFFHPAMPDDPIIFVEIALGKGSASSIGPLIQTNRQVLEASGQDTATFYSISNCHKGLQGISFGNFLIKQVAADLSAEMPGIRRFETLSPVPSFRGWLERGLAGNTNRNGLHEQLRKVQEIVHSHRSLQTLDDSVREAALKLCAHYLLEEKQVGVPLDPVARFHLGNGATLDYIHWGADMSDTGRTRSLGIMVNYLYEDGEIEKNHEAYFAQGRVVASSRVRKLARV